MESEPEMASNLMQEVEAIQIQPQYSNKWVWMVEPRGEYTTKSAYGLLSQEGQVEDNNDKVVFVEYGLVFNSRDGVKQENMV